MSAGDRLDDDIESLEQRLADMASTGGDAAEADEAVEVLARLAEAVFPGRVAMGDPSRILWPEARPKTGKPRLGTTDPREQLEHQIRQSEARFRSLVEQLPAVVFYAALGDEENEVYVSPQIESLLGFTQEEWLTNPLLWYSQLHPDDHVALIEAFTKGVQTGDPFRAEVRFFSRDGEEVWILGEARLIRDEAQRPAYFQGVGFDITLTKRAQDAMAQAERAKAETAQTRAEALATHNIRLQELNQEMRLAKEAAEAAAQARSTFLTTMSHELRTPLNSVIVLAGLLADEDLTAAQNDMVRRMRLASDNLLELINDVLEFSRLRAGQVELDQRTFDLVAWIEDTLEIVAPRAAEKGLELRLVVAGGVPQTLTADQSRLRQVLINLLANAVKFTTQGSVEVRVSAQRVPEASSPAGGLVSPAGGLAAGGLAAGALRAGGWEFECAVRDTGIGIRSEDAAGLFDEFRQADSGISREFGGTGLGLAICRRLCELLGGRIWVEQEEGDGATVAFTWLAEADDDPLTPASGYRVTVGTAPAGASGASAGAVVAAGAGAGAVVGGGSGGASFGGAGAAPAGATGRPPPPPSSLRILVAEDNLMNQQVALLLLSALGYRADLAGNGDEAIAAVRTRPYDIVLMDVAMPGTDGLSATRAIRHLGSDVYQPYIVALTAHAFPGDAETCIAAGMDDYVAKPVDRAQLARALDAGARRAAANRDFANGDAGLAGFDGAASGNAASTAAPATAATATVIETETASTPATVAPGDTTADDRDGDFDPSLPDQLLAEFGPEPFSRLVGIFQSEAIRLVGAATTAVAIGDVSQAEKTAHTLKSSAANLGAQGLYESCGRLEALARSGSLDGAELLTARMEGQLTTALRRLDEIVRGVGHP
ncbi:MAG: hypothetical protein QOF81_1992 [Acidimicrobiaceae bacterium]|nr:hypothetical protein [Acidimicrobiaceae bacterium]